MSADLASIAQRLVAPGKGILATDDFTAGITKRFADVGVESTAVTRRDFREMLFTTKAAMRNHISGVILYDETFHQTARNGALLRELIASDDVLVGVKLDKGQKPFNLELLTDGLDDLQQRIANYKKLGASFGKWRAVLSITDKLPSSDCIIANTSALARYADMCQSQDIVPIVEPDILMSGDHSIERCAEVTAAVLTEQFEQLKNVNLQAMILKPNMVTAGSDCARQPDRETVAQMTFDVLHRCVPPSVAGIAFLSGGQSSINATAHLQLMNARGDLPWPLTFSYNRALQDYALKTWVGKDANIPAAQKAFAHRAEMNSLASRGQWSPALEIEN
jgi:fructose-bisphosphate aldolase, class I